MKNVLVNRVHVVLLISLTFLPVMIGQAFAMEVPLIWDPSASPDISHYNVYYGTSSGDYNSQEATPDNRIVFTVTGLNDGTAYCFAVTAVDMYGNESAYSNEVCTDAGEEHGTPEPVLIFVDTIVANPNLGGNGQNRTVTVQLVEVYDYGDPRSRKETFNVGGGNLNYDHRLDFGSYYIVVNIHGNTVKFVRFEWKEQ